MPKRGKAHILVACGTSIATSTMVSEILRDDLVRHQKYPIEFHHCKTSELLPKVEFLEPDIIISTAPVKKEWLEKWTQNGITFFKGQPFLTGVGVEPLMEELIKVLDAMEIRKS
jgi:PTS system galactitol-specific IIB component